MAAVAGKRNEAKRWEVIFDTVGTGSQKTFGRSSFSGERNQQAVRTWKSNRKCRYGISDEDVVALSGTAGADVGRIEDVYKRQNLSFTISEGKTLFPQQQLFMMVSKKLSIWETVSYTHLRSVEYFRKRKRHQQRDFVGGD